MRTFQATKHSNLNVKGKHLLQELKREDEEKLLKEPCSRFMQMVHATHNSNIQSKCLFSVLKEAYL